ncbi:MAG TPA: bifunctional glutamine synthetase adenylyltransferase/deadenyltransferase, partial [Burkholderiales bacterium]|nr:bifunctional glutamine synthetase adenylyltransferase/deadenyltransferase [Burkholderiales bacterium]
MSRYLDRQLAADAALLNGVDLRQPVLVAALPAEKHAAQTDLKRALRRLRRQIMARLIVRDLAGWAGLAEVTAAMTALAEISVQHALDWLVHDLEQAFGSPLGETGGMPQQLMV